MAGKGNPNWIKGVSGNPSGHSKKLNAAAETAKLMLAKGSEAAVARLLELVNSSDQTIAFKAAECIVKHVKGNPKTEISGPDGAPLLTGVLVLPPESDDK